MPIYEYKCEQCDHELEALQKMSDDPLKKCPACESESLKKKISAAAFRLKGGGWYETDFKSGKKKNLAAGDSPASNSSSSDKAKKSETKASKPASAG
ncbi:MAG: zinc ribbon domain-containing protein [Agarilytica sp.]